MTSSSDFEPKLVMASRSSSVFWTSWPIVSTRARLRQFRGRSDSSSSSIARSRSGETVDGATSPSSSPRGSSVSSATSVTRLRSVSPAEASSVARRDRPVGLDLERELVVVRGLLDPRGLHRERDSPHRREDRVDGDEPDRRRALVALCRQVAAALLDGEVDREPALGVHRCEVELGVEHLDVGRGLDVAGGDLTGAARVEAERDGLLGRALEHEVLDVQDEVGDVFLHAGNDVELVQRFVETHLRDGCAGDRRQERAAQAVPERVAEAGLERTDRELLEVAVGLGRLDLGTLDDEHWAAPLRAPRIGLCNPRAARGRAAGRPSRSPSIVAACRPDPPALHYCARRSAAPARCA